MARPPVRIQPKPATDHTRAANQAVLKELPFENRRDFEDAVRGLIAELTGGRIVSRDGKRVRWDLNQYDFLEGEAPDTVNPSLWRQGQLNLINGLFEVTDGIYQLRGLDLANITFIRGDTGWIIVDPLTVAETARTALDMADKHLGQRPVRAVIYTHSHVDHYGGVRGVVSEEDIRSGKIQISKGKKRAEKKPWGNSQE